MGRVYKMHEELLGVMIWLLSFFFFSNLFFGHSAYGNLSSPARDQTCAPAVEAQSLNHWDRVAFLIIVVVLFYMYI